MEHKFMTPSDKFINAIVITKTRLINCNAEDVMKDLLVGDLDMESMKKIKPEMPFDLKIWIEYNTISSEKLRNGVV